MTEADRREFCKLLVGIAELYDKRLTTAAQVLYWDLLKDYELDDIASALKAHTKSPDAGQYLPKPADIIRQLEGDTESQAMRAWSKVQEAIGRVGPYRSVVFDDPLIHAVVVEMGGWIALCEGLTDDLPFRAREFVKRYRGYRTQRAQPRYPPKLVGLIEQHNAAHEVGEDISEPLLIGDSWRALQVMREGVVGPRLEVGPVSQATRVKLVKPAESDITETEAAT